MQRLPDSELERITAYCELVSDGVYIGNDRKGIRTLEFAREAATDLPRLVAAYRELRELARDLDRLLVCYRVGKRPSDALLTRLERKDAYLKGDAREADRVPQ